MSEVARRRVAPLVLILLLVVAPLPAVAAAGETVERIIIQGLNRMSEEAFLHAFGIRVGDPYDPDQIRERFGALWDLKLFQDLTIEVETGPTGGRVLLVKIQERPVVTSISYDETSVVTRTQIEDRYRERKVGLELGKPLDMGKVFFAEAAIRDLVSERGYLDARVSAEVRVLTETTRAVHFAIRPGGKTRIRSIDFTGNTVFSDRKLESALKLTRERQWYWPWSSKNLYHPVKWDQDVSVIRDAYQHRGYLDVEIRPPVVEVRQEEPSAPPAAPASAPPAPAEPAPAAAGAPDSAEASAELTPKQREKAARREQKRQEKAVREAQKREADQGKRWVYLTVPITEGEPYTLGEITLSGNEVFASDLLRQLIPLRPGSTLSATNLELGVQRITRAYEDRGHLYANVTHRIRRREGANIADVEMTVEEDEPYYIGRIDFRGNSATHDRVLRRELLVDEGDLFSRTRIDRSRGKINQLGYFQVTEPPLVEPIAGEKRVRVTYAGEEQGRNEIQVGGGYSGLDGAFFNGVYSTRNFLGRGQVLSTAVQIGGRSTLFQVSFHEPWFLNRPYLFGVNVYQREVDYGNSLQSESSGGGITLGRRLTPSSRISVGYQYEDVTSTTFAGTSADPIQFESTVVVSSITPVYAYSTVNNPYRPSGGQSFNVSLQVAGGFIGGDTSFLRPLANYTGYRRAFGRTYLAFHTEVGVIREFGESDLPVNSSEVEGVPRFERFWLGGETLGPRAFETRTITPRRYVVLGENNEIIDVLGDPRFLSPEDLVNSGGVPVLVEVGGDRMYLVQSELVVPLNEQAELAVFFDAGDALFEDTSLNFSTIRMSAGVELRFHLPIFPVPLRLIYGVPIRRLEGDRTSNFTFSIGRSF